MLIKLFNIQIDRYANALPKAEKFTRELASV